MLKQAVAIRHIAFEDLGFFEAPLRAAGYDIRYVEAAGGELASIDPVGVDLLVVLGGPMGVYESDLYPFLTQEIALIRARIDAGRPILGICLGSQLIAHALGARVYAGPVKEIGFAPVTLTPEGAASPLGAIAAGQPVLHWHGDTFDLPEGATLLASTQAYANQAFAVGNHVLALQFHLEAGAEIDRWLVGHAEELRGAGIAPAPIGEGAARNADALAVTARTMLETWLARA